MDYRYEKSIRENDQLRESFNDLTRIVFGFDLSEWYQRGFWKELYIPHVLINEKNQVISNISVNKMTFNDNGKTRNYIQIGTVMTHPDYQKQGWNRFLMEKILNEYETKCDGIYLFGNDSVLNYYPKFGFEEAKEYEYRLNTNQKAEETGSEKITFPEPEVHESEAGYHIEKTDLSKKIEEEMLYRSIKEQDRFIQNHQKNPNDAFYMSENLGLFQFWVNGEYKDKIYYIPEKSAYLAADNSESILYISQIFGAEKVDITKVVTAFNKKFATKIKEVVLGFTPTDKRLYQIHPHKIKNCTLFVRGDEIKANLKEEQLLFPKLSHA